MPALLPLVLSQVGASRSTGFPPPMSGELSAAPTIVAGAEIGFSYLHLTIQPSLYALLPPSRMYLCISFHLACALGALRTCLLPMLYHSTAPSFSGGHSSCSNPPPSSSSNSCLPMSRSEPSHEFEVLFLSLYKLSCESMKST